MLKLVSADKLVSILDTYMNNKFSVFFHCFVDANAVKVKFLCQVDGFTSLLHGVPHVYSQFQLKYLRVIIKAILVNINVGLIFTLKSEVRIAQCKQTK